MRPIALPFEVSRRHDPSVDVSPLSSEKTFEASLLLTRKTLHESSCKGNAAAKSCKKCSSEILNVRDVAECRLKVRDDKSAIRLSTPEIDTEMSGDASFS
jgi:hypothetical protein